MVLFSIRGALSQAWPPKPKFTEKNIPSLAGKVYIVTGSNAGVGKEVARILYSKNAKVYIAARSKERALKAIEDIQKTHPSSSGKLAFLHLDLNDLTTIKASVQAFLSKETQLHVIFNNAGVMTPPQGSHTVQGYEQCLGINNIGPFLFTKLLTPFLISTAKLTAPNTVRVVWVSSSGAEYLGVKSAGVPIDNLDYHKEESAGYKYGVSKAGNYLHSCEFAKRYKGEGLISVSLNPGNLVSELANNQPGAFQWMKRNLADYPTVNGAYTELFAGLSPEVTLERTGDWGKPPSALSVDRILETQADLGKSIVVPFGRFMDIRKDLVEATKTKAEGGTGVGLRFWEWNEEQVRPYI